MRCPKCGAFLEDGTKSCFMCGTDLQGENNNNQVTNSNPDFFTANGQNNPTSNDVYQDDYLRKKEEYENRMKNYRDVSIEAKKGDRDIIDFYLQHKKIIQIFVILLVIICLGFGGYKLYQHRDAEPIKEALVGDLYYEIDKEFVVIDRSNNSIIYSKSGDKGSECSIAIYYGSSTSGNHVDDFFTDSLKKIEPSKDREGNILDELEVFITTNNEQSIHNTTWYRMNVYYRPDINVMQYSVLRNMYLSSVYQGFYYDIELVNHANSNFCNSALDSFMNSLEFTNK